MKPKATVLIVDDVAGNRQALEVLLEDMEVETVSVDSGDAALRFLLNGEAAVVLLDVDMPGLNGFETAKLIRGREKTKHVPIVFVTAMEVDRQSMIRGYELGAVDYLIKPVVSQILRAKVGVFVELYHSHQERIQTMAEALEQEKEITSAWLEQEKRVRRFDGLWEVGLQSALEDDYREILRIQLDKDVAAGEPKVRELAERVALAGGGPREILTVHRKVAEIIMAKALPRHARSLRDRCRLLTLELMGHLADHYRRDATRRRTQFPEERVGRRSPRGRL